MGAPPKCSREYAWEGGWAHCDAVCFWSAAAIDLPDRRECYNCTQRQMPISGATRLAVSNTQGMQLLASTAKSKPCHSSLPTETAQVWQLQ